MSRSRLPNRLTWHQQHLLNATGSGRWVSGEDLLRHLAPLGEHTTAQGVHQTAASLVRRGLLEKRADPKIHYRITHEGTRSLA